MWISQGVIILKAMALQITDIAKQTWSNDILSTSSKLSECKTLLNPQKHLQVINNYFISRHLTRFKISNHQLLVEEGRHWGIDPVDTT